MKETNKIIGIDLGATNSLVAMGGDEEKNARRSVETTGGQNKHNATEDIIMETKKSKSNGEKTIHEGTRNSTLYQMGIRSRVEEGLSGNALRMKLLKINREQCELPLPENEVARIAESVDRADVSDKTTNAHHGQPRKASNRKKGTEYFVSAATDPIPVEELLQKEVSYYPNCLTNKPTGVTTIDECLETFWAGGKSETQILAVRNEPDKAKRNELKKGLHAIVFGSEPQEERKAAACKPNGIIVLDFDGIPSEELKSAKEAIAAIDYVFAVCLSVSGGGLFAFVAYEGEPSLKLLVAAMQADFPYPLDKSCSDLSRLRIVTFDENLILKEQVYPAILREEVTTLETSAKMVSPTGRF